MPKLCQIIAIVNGRKSETTRRVTDLHHKLAKVELISGLSRVYTPDDEQGEQLPSESKKVQLKVDDAIDEAAGIWSNLIDIVATQDVANCSAKADVVVDGQVILSSAPVTHLLFLEKQLVDLHTFVSKLPTLDSSRDWEYDENKGFWKTEPVQQLRTQKIQQPVVLYEATDKHPAQVQLVSKDVTVGKWATTHFSGAVPADFKQAMLERVQKLQDAVKFAREAANQAVVGDVKYGDDIFDFVLKSE